MVSRVGFSLKGRLMNKHIYFDGKKSITLDQYPSEAWTWLTGQPDDGKSGIKDYFKAVPWLYRGVSLRANAVSVMPFIIYRGEEEIDKSDEYKNTVGFLPNPKRTFKLLEMSLALMGRAYLFNVRNNVVTLELKYLNPNTIQPVIDEAEGLTGFKRTLTTTKDYEPEDIIYFWLEDPYVEIGEPETSPAKAALMASGVLANVDEYVAAYFERGATRATIFSAKGMSAGDAKTFETWWTKFITGVRNSFRTKVLNAESMEPTVVGDGLTGLQDQELTREKREDIGTALGIPHTLLFSDAANYATAGQDDFHYYDKTIVPECEFIQWILNEQVFEPLGLRLEFQPDTLDVFQRDEKERSESLGFLVQAGMPIDMAARTLGFELSDKDWLMLEEIVARKEEQAENMLNIANMAPAAGGQPDRPVDSPPNSQGNMRADLGKWKMKAKKRLRSGKSPVVDFESEYIPEYVATTITEQLETAKNAEDLSAIFDISDDVLSYAPVVAGLTDAVRLLREKA